MLNEIRDMIKAQQQCMEAASLIMEAGRSLDDIIVLGEDADKIDPVPAEEPTEDPELEPGDGGEGPDDGPGDGDVGEPGEPTDDNPPLPGEDSVPPAEGEEPLPNPGDDDLPEPVGRQTGETPVSSDDDLLNMEVNLGSNTLRDVLPQPPANAADAIADGDLLNTRVDAGFGGEDPDDGAPTPNDDFVDPVNPPAPQSDVPPAEGEEPAGDPGAGESVPPVDNGGDGAGENPAPVGEEDGDLLGASMDEEPVGESASLTEAITLGDEPQPAAQPAGDQQQQPAEGGDGISEPPVDAGTETPTDGAAVETPAEEPAEDNEVTAAVKDKVSEVEEPTPGTSITKEDLLNKLSNVTKNIEDIKKGLVAQGFGTN
ncbi:MAG: hypothetical protein NC131_10970 [Roseburia sp.]|nr:hypothetical protein [Roseburia sp.]